MFDSTEEKFHVSKRTKHIKNFTRIFCQLLKNTVKKTPEFDVNLHKLNINDQYI